MAFTVQYNTTALQTLLNQAVSGGGAISITSIQVGSGFPAASDNPENYTGLKNPVQTLGAITSPSNLSGITSINAAVLYQTTVRFQVSSQDAPLTYQWNEYGVFAKVGSGSPVLICYVTTGAATGDTVTPSGTGVPLIKQNATIINYSLNATTTTSLTLVNTVDLHATTHLDNGVDPVPVATTSRTGSLPKLSGNASTFLDGTGLWSIPGPSGIMSPFAGSIAPIGWLLCDGSSYATTGIYANLFSVIGYTYGGSGASFNVPDMRGRMVLGVGISTAPGATNHVRGSIGGEETHTLNIVEMPSHGHGVNDPKHIHTVNDLGHAHSIQCYSFGAAAGPNSIPIPLSLPGQTSPQYTDEDQAYIAINSASTGISLQNNGSGSAHQNLPPFVTLQYIIKL